MDGVLGLPSEGEQYETIDLHTVHMKGLKKKLIYKSDVYIYIERIIYVSMCLV